MRNTPLSVTGAAIIGAAILLSWLPGFYGPGLLWSVLALVLGLITVQQQLRLPQVQLPPALNRPWIAPLFTVVAVVLTWSIIGVNLVGLLWLGGTACLVYDRWKCHPSDPSGLRFWFNWQAAWRGYRRLMLVGLAVMFVALLFTFDKGSASWFMGGFDYNYSSYHEGYVSSYNATKYLMPGIPSSTGRAQSFATVIMFVMAAVALWTGFSFREGTPAWLRHKNTILIGAGLPALWWLISPKQAPGSWLFLLGLIPVCAGAYFLYRGEESGKWDGSDWLEKIPLSRK